METARQLVERGKALMIFPEGTRIRRGSLGDAQARRRPARARDRRAGRPGRRAGHRARAARLHHPPVQGARPLRPPADLPARREPVGAPGGRGHRPDLAVRRAPVRVARRHPRPAHGRRRRRRADGHGARKPAGARRARGGAGLPHARAGRADRRQPARTTTACRASSFPTAISARPVSKIEFQAVDLVVFAVPSRDLPAAVGEVAASIGRRTAVLVCSKGLVAPVRDAPVRVRRRARPRARRRRAGRPGACRGGGDRATPPWWSPRRTPTCGVSSSACSRRRAAGVEETDDVVGTELAAAARTSPRWPRAPRPSIA